MGIFDKFLRSTESEQEEIFKPLCSVDMDDEKELLKWLNGNYRTLRHENEGRFNKMKDNLKKYKNEWSNTGRQGDGRYNDYGSTTKNPRFRVNHLYENTEVKVSFMSRLKPAVEILPTNDEVKDKYAARVAGMFKSHLWEQHNVDYLMQQRHRTKYITGEGYFKVVWNPDLGDLHPEYVKAKSEGKVLETEDQSKEIVVEDGIEAIIPANPKVGEVDLTEVMPWNIVFQTKPRFLDAEYCFETKCEHKDILKKEYPDKAESIKSTNDTVAYDAATMEEEKRPGHVEVREFWHKRTKYYPKGLHIIFTNETILLQEELKYSHGKLPYVRITDIDVPGCMHAVSFYEQAAPIQAMSNNINTAIAQSMMTGAYPKWMMQQGSASVESLSNTATIVQVKPGAPFPQLAAFNPVSSEAFAFDQQLTEKIRTISSTPSVMHGINPTGITKPMALQFLNEQANERNSTDIAKHNMDVVELTKMMLSVAGDYYQADDGRTMRILGENGKYLITVLDTAVFSKNYDIRINPGSALPEFKTAKIERILEMMQYNKDLLPSERWVDLLDLGSTEKMTTLITAALDAAESESEDLLDGKPVGEPEEQEDQIIHWETHVKAFQRREFKEKASDETKAAAFHHIEMHEMIMFYKAQENPLFMAKVAQLPQFPLFFKIPPGSIVSAQQAAMQAQTAAQQGMPTEAQIPADENARLSGTGAQQ